MKATMKRVLVFVLCFVLCIQTVALPAKAWTVYVVPGVTSVGANTSSTNHNYSVYWQYWSQGASKYQLMRDYGCRIVAQSKLLVETGVVSSDISVFNPDLYAEWGVSQGFWRNLTDNLNETTASGKAAITYAANQGVTLSQGYVSLSGSNTAADVQTVMDYINAGYYIILHSSAHQAYVGRQASLNEGTPVILDSWYSHSYTPSACQTYSGYTLVNFSGFYYYALDGEIEPTFAWKNGTQTAYDTNFYAYTEATSNVSGIFTEAGITVWDKDKNIVAQKFEYPSYSNSMMQIWYNVTDEIGVTLQKGTTYTYQFHTRFNYDYYYSPVYTITTTGMCDVHTFGDWNVTTEATCTVDGSRTRGCTVCGYSESEVLSATGHHWEAAAYTDADCQNPASHTFVCQNCQEVNVVTDELTWSDWSETYPEDAASGQIESKTQYRYRDRESSWDEGEIRTLDYATDWSGFDTTIGYYQMYNNTPVTEYETETEKLTILSDEVVGYLYHHWCRNYQYGPLNRRVYEYYTDTYWMPHVFYSTEDAPLYDHEGSYGEGAYYVYNADCCKDSWWYVRIPVYRQTYLVQTKVSSGENWTEWSEWSDSAETATENREVETRTVYRYVTGGLGDHDYADGVCSVCGREDPDYNAAQIMASGWSGYTQWTLTSDGVLTVYGSGNMKNYNYDGGQPWLDKGVDITTVVIEEGVTSVGSGAFMNLTTLESVSLPESLTQMGEAAFYGTGLTFVEIPASLWTIQPYTFKNCTALAAVKFNEGNLMKISDGAFYNTALTTVELPDCLDILDEYTFKNCAQLESITIGSGITEIREAVFYGTAIPTITIPEGITKIGPYAFKNCVSLETIDLPESLTSVGEASFYACTALESVVFPDAVTTIGNYAFRKCAAIETLTFGSELTSIGECGFYGCTGLTELVIPDKVTTIKPYAFKTCTGLTSVTLGSSVTTIGEGAFNTCTGLETIVFPASVQTIGDYCFSGSEDLWKLTFQGDAPSIGTGAFKGLDAYAYYPGDNATWTSDIMQNYGGSITWQAN